MASDAGIPRHVAIVMDGNGRWAKRRYLPRVFGHKAGVDTLVKTVLAATRPRHRAPTVFAFSSGELEAPGREVSFLMGLVLVAVAVPRQAGLARRAASA